MADIFCDGPDGNGCQGPARSAFVEQCETYWNSNKGCAAGAWAKAKGQKWERRRHDGRIIHLCPHCKGLSCK